MNTVKMTAPALRRIMGGSFDHGEYEKGRQAVKEQLSKGSMDSEKLLDETRRVLEGGNYSRRPGPSYWIGCLSELDFV